jgi:hypothetical protein
MGRMDGEMQIVAICQEFGWTYQDYHSQPAYFIQLIKEKMVRDAKRAELNNKK